MTLFKLKHKKTGKTYIGTTFNTIAEEIDKIISNEKICPELAADIKNSGLSRFKSQKITSSESGVKIAKLEKVHINMLKKRDMCYNDEPILCKFYNL